jgi:putative transposase
VERATGKAVSKSAASRMRAEKSREQLELLRSRPLNDVDWLGVLIDGVWLTREICVVVAVGIDKAGSKRVLDFEQGTSENISVVTALIERLAVRGVEAKERRLLVGRDGNQAIETAIGRVWPEAVQQECLVHAHSNLRDKLRRCDRADLDIHFKRLREAQGRQGGDFVSERNWHEATGITFGYLRFTDTRSNKIFVTLKCLYGFTAVKTDGLKRIVKP